MPRAIDDLAAELDRLASAGLRRHLRTVDGVLGRSVVIDGRPVINLSSNDYLGLAGHPALAEAAAAGVREAGTGAGASRLIIGNQRGHEELERDAAAFQRRDRALLFNSGYHANVGTIQALVGRGDEVFSDQLNHASIIDGCRLSRAKVTIFAHGDAGSLEGGLARSSAARKLVVTDAIFSMDGDRARLRELAAVASRFGAMLMVDEAHSTGAIGPGGRGLSAELGVEPDIHMSTFGKALGGFGAYVAGDEVLCEYLLNRARSFVFTTALPPAVVRAGSAALRLVAGREGDELRSALERNIRAFRLGLEELGLLAVGAGQSAIFPIIVGDTGRTMECCQRLLAAGYYAQGIRPPTVPRGTSRMRVTLMATHTEQDVHGTLEELRCMVADGLLPTGDRDRTTEAP